MIDARCPWCSADGDDQPKRLEAHHVTGRDGHGRYLDPALTLACCVTHHHTDHQCWRLLDIAQAGADPNVARLLRLSFLTGRLADVGPAVSFAPSWWAAMTRLLTEVADDLKGRQRCP